MTNFRPHIKINSTTNIPGLHPNQLRRAYSVDLVPGQGLGQKIGIIGAYSYPNLQSDVNFYCDSFGIPRKIITVLGNPTTQDTGWNQETALDIVSALIFCPKAQIVVSLANSSSDSDLFSAISSAVNYGCQVISMSWGGSQFSQENSLESYFTNTNVTFVSSSGDDGAGTEYPSSSPNVLSVGGTTLYVDINGNKTKQQTAWAGSGGGNSSYFPRPLYQNGFTTSSTRSVPDVSCDADPNSGISVYCNGQFLVVGGTSLAAPLWAGIITLANQALVNLGKPVLGSNAIKTLYQLATSNINSLYFNDVISGNDGQYSAQNGYDLVTGLGTPVVNNLIQAISALPFPISTTTTTPVLATTTTTPDISTTTTTTTTTPVLVPVTTTTTPHITTTPPINGPITIPPFIPPVIPPGTNGIIDYQQAFSAYIQALNDYNSLIYNCNNVKISGTKALAQRFFDIAKTQFNDINTKLNVIRVVILELPSATYGPLFIPACQQIQTLVLQMQASALTIINAAQIQLNSKI